jgi:hypothetical protein
MGQLRFCVGPTQDSTRAQGSGVDEMEAAIGAAQGRDSVFGESKSNP